jgi:hypothetical protein
MRKLRTSTLQDGRKKYNGSKEMAVQVLAALIRIGECLMEVSPTYGEAWNGQMRCTTGADQANQEHEAMEETALQLYETFSQSGAPALTMMRNILENFRLACVSGRVPTQRQLAAQPARAFSTLAWAVAEALGGSLGCRTRRLVSAQEAVAPPLGRVIPLANPLGAFVVEFAPSP